MRGRLRTPPVSEIYLVVPARSGGRSSLSIAPNQDGGHGRSASGRCPHATTCLGEQSVYLVLGQLVDERVQFVRRVMVSSVAGSSYARPLTDPSALPKSAALPVPGLPERVASVTGHTGACHPVPKNPPDKYLTNDQGLQRRGAGALVFTDLRCSGGRI